MVDLKYMKEYKVISEGHIEKFTNIDTSVPSVSFIAYRKISDKNKLIEYREEITYKFAFEGYHWLINDISFKYLKD